MNNIKQLFHKSYSINRLHAKKFVRQSSSLNLSANLPIYHESTYTSPQFEVGFTNGFQAKSPPIEELPNRFFKLEQILTDMPYSHGGLLS